jgi:hypothetical protein
MTKSPAERSRIIQPAHCRFLLLAGLCTALILPASAHAAAPPPELAPLLQETSQLQISSERFSGEVSIVPKKLPAKLKGLGALNLKLSGEASTSPAAAAVTTTVLDQSISLRLVDETIYVHEAALGKLDGGRPWVKFDHKSSGKLFGSNPGLDSNSGLGSSGGQGSHFEIQTALLKASKDVRSLGSSTVDGQAVTGFAGTVDPKQVEESQLSAKLRRELLKAHVKPAATFEVFIAANGLPVHSKIVLALGRAKLTVTADVLAINFPVVPIAAPPASETITTAELEKLEKQKLEKHKKKK